MATWNFWTQLINVSLNLFNFINEIDKSTVFKYH